LRFTEIQVKATVILGNQEQSSEVDKLSELAEKYCLVSNSVACPIHYKVEIKE
jgi:organic hydroperoxide reductase OsmC/OhrA